MSYIYIDESGDLGFNLKKYKPPSHYFTIAAIVVTNRRENKKLKRIMKRCRQRKLKKKYKQKPELKFSNSNAVIRKYVLKELMKLDITIQSLTINKKHVRQHLKEKPDILNNYIFEELLGTCLKTEMGKHLLVSIDRCLQTKKQDELKDYIQWKLSEQLNNIPKVEFNHEYSRSNKGLQVVDFVAGSIQQVYEYGNREYVNMILDKLQHKGYFMKKKIL